MKTKRFNLRAIHGATALAVCAVVTHSALSVGAVPTEPAPAVKPEVSTSQNTPAAPLALYAGQVLVVPQTGVERVAIGNGKVISASVVAGRQIVVLGEGTGTTSLHVWLRDGSQLHYEVTVSMDDTTKIVRELRQLLSRDTGITVNSVGNRVVLDGTYADANAATRIGKIVKAYPQILNLVREQPEAKVVVAEPMVQLDVKIVQVRKQALDNIGVQWNNLGITGPTVATSTANMRANVSQQGFPLTSAARPFISYFGLATQMTSVLNFLESNGDSWILAEPRISSVSGGSAKVQLGGEIPIPVSSGLGEVTVVYKQYGVILEFKPVIDKDGNVRSTIVAEVSDPDRTQGTGDFVAFTMNRTETEVSLKQNETLVISGLLKSVGSRNTQGLPALGRVPVLGRLFSSQELSTDQTELLVVVTPHLHTPSLDREQLLANESANQQLIEMKKVIEQKLAR